MANIKTTIEPWLSVANSAKAGAFYKQAFGAVETYRMETPEGGLVLKLTVDGAGFWVSGQTTGSAEEMSARTRQEAVKIILTVEDPDALFEQAVRAGAKEVFPIGEDFGWRLGRLSDPYGFDWEIGKPLEAE